MDQLSHQDQLIQLQRLGVRTDKKIQVMYSDLFRITENIFHTECLRHEGYEAEDFFKDPEFNHLRELKKHLESVMEWMFSDGLPEWPKRCQKSHEQIQNPYLSIHPDSSWNEIHSAEFLIAAFNIRCGKPGEKFERDREYILDQLEKKHYCLSALKNYSKKDSALIPPIGIAVMEQKIYFPEAGKVYAGGFYDAEAAFQAWEQKYERKFKRFSNNELLAFHNNRVDRNNNSAVWGGILQALLKEFLNREIDISSIAVKEKLLMKKCVVLVSDKLHSADELPAKIIEQMIMLYNQEKGLSKTTVSNCKIEDGKIHFLSNNSWTYIDANHLLRFFSGYLTTPSKTRSGRS